MQDWLPRLGIVALLLIGNLEVNCAPQNEEVNIKLPDLNTTQLKLEFPVGKWSPDLATWRAPDDMYKELPWYIMGYDYEKRPVIVLEFGKWDGRKWVEKGGQTFKDYDKHWEQFWWTVDTTKSPFPDAEDGVVLIVDFKGFAVRQLANADAMANYLVQARRSEAVQDQVVDFLIINMNFVAQTWMNLIGSVAGKLVGRAELYGAQNPEKWLFRLKEKIPVDQLPPWYGGSKSFKPVSVHG